MGIVTQELANELGLSQTQVLELNKYFAFVRLKPISDLENALNPVGGFLPIDLGGGELFKISFSVFTQIIGKVAKPINPSGATPTEEGWYRPEISSEDNKNVDPNDWGTLYANAGNKRAKAGYDSLFYFSGAEWAKTESELAKANVNSVKGIFSKVTSTDLSGFVDITLLEGDENIADKDLYVVFFRTKTHDSSGTTIFQIGEKAGSEVGVNQHLISSYISTTNDQDSNGMISFETTPENNSGVKFSVILNMNKFVAGVDTDVDLADRLQLNSHYYGAQAKELKGFPIFRKVKTILDKSFIVDAKTYNSSVSDYKNSDGSWKELFITFMRFKNLDGVGTSIVTVTQKVGSVINSSGDVATASLDLAEDSDGLINMNLKPWNNSNIFLSLLIDTKKLRANIDTGNVFTDQIQLSTQYLVNQIAENDTSRTLTSFGDSVTEMKNYPQLVGEKLGAKYFNVGIGGTTLGKNNSVHYTEINFPNLVKAVVTNNWTSVDAAVEYIKNNESDDNTAIITRLKSIDFTKVTDVSIFYGTNDFTGSNTIGTISLTNEDITTTVGGLNKGIKDLLTAFPHLKVYIITPYHRFIDSGLTQDSDLVPNSIGKYLIEYVDAIKEISAMNHLPCFDFYRSGQFSKYNHSLYFDDGVHQNDLGNKIISSEIAKFISR